MQKLNEQQEAYEIELQTKEKYIKRNVESNQPRQLLMEEKQMDQVLGHCQVQGNRQISHKCKDQQGNIEGYGEGERGRKQTDGFFSDIGEDRKSSRGSRIFKRTYSFYQQQQQTQQKHLSPQQPLPVTSMPQLQPLPTNKYTKYIDSSTKLLKYLRIGYYMHVLRFLFIVFVYYNLNFIQTYSNVNANNHINSNSNAKKDNAQPTDENNNGNDKNYFLPWNAMIYILSGSIDFISIIGYISSIKLLRSDIKVLEAKHKIQADKLQRERQQKYLKKSAHHIVEQIQIAPAPLQQPLAQAQNQIPLILRIGPEQTYSCVYSCLRAYKYKNRDQAASFKISKVMHIGATFLFFGRMALEQLLEYQLQSGDSAILVEAALWVFLVLAFLGVFQVDLFVIQSSTGPNIKIEKFCYGKIEQVYKQFWQWRKCYAAILSIGIVVSALWIIFECIKTVINQNKTNKLTSIIFILCILCFISSISILCIVRKGLKSSKSYIKQLPKTWQKKDENSENTFHEQKSLQKMIIHKDLSLLGILHKYSIGADKYVYSINRVALLLYGLALLRQVGIEDVGNADDMGGYLATFGFFVAAEFFKFVVLIKSKINLLDSCKYSQLNGSQNSSQSQNKDASGEVSSCSVCLVQYSAQEKVVVLCCGHIFHEQCLLDWLKQKKQCPFCRYNISEYYEQASF